MHVRLSTDVTPTTWLLLLYALPTRRNAERVNLWRKLKKFGAVALQTSGYVLPDEPAQLERFQWFSRQIRDAGGEATLIRVAEIDGMSNGELVGMFNDARATEYRKIATNCREALAKYGRRQKTALAVQLEKCRRRFREIREIDYFDSPGAHDAQMVLERVEKLLSPGQGDNAPPRADPKEFVGKLWLTRPRPGIDRAGSAWLIRKFIDPDARFVFDMDLRQHPGAVPFDMADVEFSHHGDHCTFETFVKRFGITDKRVLKMAEMVHDADLEDQKFARCECVGINCVMAGWARAGVSDHELLVKGMDLFEGLYTAPQK